MDAIVASLPSATVRDLGRLGPREAAESVAAFLARETASGSTLFAETVAPLTDPAGPASKSARRAAAFKTKARDAFARNRLAEALDHLTTALKLAPEEKKNIHRSTVNVKSSTPTAGSLRNDRAAVLLRLASEHDKTTREHSRSCGGSATRSETLNYARLALLDAAVAAAADASCRKSRLRLGVAARALGRLEIAKSAFRDALGRMATTDPARRSVERRLAEAVSYERQTRRSRSDDATGSPGITKNDANAKSPDIATDIAPDDAPDESCRTDRNATPKETRTVEVRLVSNDSNDTAHCGLGVFSTSPRMDPGDVFGSPDGEFASASVPAKSNRSSRCSFCHRALSVAPTPCRTCSVSSYCDEACRDEDVAHAKFECGIETSGCWWSVLPSETRLAMRCLAANASDENAPIRALHRRWADFDADARARLAVTAAVASHCATRRREHLAVALSPGAVLEATCAVLGNAFAVKSPSRGGTSSFSPDPRSAEVSRLASLRAALVTMSQKPIRNLEPYLDAWFVLSEEAETVALATFPETSRLNHSCDPNAHVELVLSPARENKKRTTFARSDGAVREVPHGRRYFSQPVVRATTRVTRRCGTDEELRVSYGPVVGSAPRRARRERLRLSHGFTCACEGCLCDDEDEPSRGGADVAAVDDDDVARWGVVLDDARASFASSCDTDSARSAHLKRLETAVGELRARTNARGDGKMAKRNARSFRERKLLAEALDARALGLVTLSRACACHARGLAHVEHAASSAREALHVLVGSLGYPEEDSLTVALERARVAALDAACSRFEASRADLERARRVLRAALGGSHERHDTRELRRVVDGGLERRALFAVDALLASFSPNDFSRTAEVDAE